MCTYNAISSHTDHFEIQKRDSEESLLTFVNLFPNVFISSKCIKAVFIIDFLMIIIPFYEDQDIILIIYFI